MSSFFSSYQRKGNSFKLIVLKLVRQVGEGVKSQWNFTHWLVPTGSAEEVRLGPKYQHTSLRTDPFGKKTGTLHKRWRHEQWAQAGGSICCWSTCSGAPIRRCRSWSTRCSRAGQRSWRSSVSSASRTPGRAGPEPWAWTSHPVCTSSQILRRNASPRLRRSPFLPAADRRPWRGPERRWDVCENKLSR